MLWLRHVPAGTEISKKLTSNPRLSAKNTPLFLFPQMGHSLQIFVKVMPLHIHVFSFTHNAVVLSPFRCVHPENQTKFFLIFTFYESKQMSLTQDWRWSLGRSIALQLQRRTDLLLCTINCFLQWDHLPNMVVGDLAFYYTLYLWLGLELGLCCFQTNLPLAALPLWWWYLYNCASATYRRRMTKRQAASSQLIDNLAALPTAADRRQLNSIQLGSDAARW